MPWVGDDSMITQRLAGVPAAHPESIDSRDELIGPLRHHDRPDDYCLTARNTVSGLIDNI